MLKTLDPVDICLWHACPPVGSGTGRAGHKPVYQLLGRRAIVLPLILAYAATVYRLFRGKIVDSVSCHQAVAAGQFREAVSYNR